MTILSELGLLRHGHEIIGEPCKETFLALWRGFLDEAQSKTRNYTIISENERNKRIKCKLRTLPPFLTEQNLG